MIEVDNERLHLLGDELSHLPISTAQINSNTKHHPYLLDENKQDQRQEVRQARSPSSEHLVGGHVVQLSRPRPYVKPEMRVKCQMETINRPEYGCVTHATQTHFSVPMYSTPAAKNVIECPFAHHFKIQIQRQRLSSSIYVECGIV